jgi:hypothetical protein
MSVRRSNSHRQSRRGFSPLPTDHMQHGDATIDIPLQQVPSAAHRNDSSTPFAAEGDGLTKTMSRKTPRTFGNRKARDAATNESVGYDGEEDTLNRMGRFYNAVLNFSIITRYIVYVSPLAICIAIPIIIGVTSAPNAKIGGVPMVWFFTWIEVGE